jgi:hypothetical protein
MKTFYKISLGLLVLTCNIFSCKNDVVPLPRSMKLASPSPSVYGGVTTVMTGLYNLGPMAVDAAHNFYFIPYNTGQLFDTTGIYKVTPAGVKTLLAGGPFHPPLDGTGANARFW